MATVLVDSNVLLDILTEDSKWFAWSANALAHASNQARIVINPIVYAEISVRFSKVEDLEAALPPAYIDREAIPFEAAFLAAKAYSAYRRRKGAKVSPLPDFFIGAHAAAMSYELLTRDAARYRTYFPGVRLISPA